MPMKAVQLARLIVSQWSLGNSFARLRKTISPPEQRRELVLGSGCFVAYAIAFFLVCGTANQTTFGPSSSTSALSAIWWLTALPAITAGWTWGLRAGFVTGVILSPVNAILFELAGLPGWSLISAMPGVWAHAIAPLAGAVFGRLHEVNCALQTEREQGRNLLKELQLTRRSLDATLQLLNDQATQAHHSLEAKGRAEAESQRSQKELASTKVRLSYTTLTDVRTDLPNRRAAMEFLNQEWTGANQRNRPLSCIVVNVDEVAPVRAMHGHEMADQVVRETAEILHDSIRETDRLFSLGGEEFMIVCPNVDGNQLLECAERLRALVEVNTVIVGNTTHHVTMSVGVASNQDAALRTADELLRRSQQALLSAQQQGCNRVVCLESPSDVDHFDVLSVPNSFQRVAGR